MQHFVDVVGSLPVILAIAEFIGVVVLVRLLLSPNSVERRRSQRDRRRGQAMPEMPFYDSDRILVTCDRRTYKERRKRAFMFITTQRRV